VAVCAKARPLARGGVTRVGGFGAAAGRAVRGGSRVGQGMRGEQVGGTGGPGGSTRRQHASGRQQYVTRCCRLLRLQPTCLHDELRIVATQPFLSLGAQQPFRTTSVNSAATHSNTMLCSSLHKRYSTRSSGNSG
jgi:hypothetical protein